MKNLTSRKLLSLLLCAIALFSLCAIPAAAYDDENLMPVIEIDREEMETVKPGEEFDFTVTLHNMDTTLTAFTPTVTFAPSSAFIILDSTPTKTVPNIRCTKTTTVTIRLKALEQIDSPSQDVKVDVRFTYESGYGRREGSASQTVFVPVETSAVSEQQAPKVVISRDTLSTVKAGDAFTLNVKVTNSGTVALDSPVFAVSAGSGLSILDSTVSRPIDDVQPGETVTVPVRLKAAADAGAGSESVEISLNYSYGAAHTKGSSSETILIPVEARAEVPQGTAAVVMTRDAVSTVKANQEFTLNVKVTNKGNVELVMPVLSVSPDSALSIMDATMSRALDNIKPGATVTVPIRLKTGSTLSSPSLSVGLDLKYNADGSGSASETVYIPAVVTADRVDEPVRIEGATPNVIISQYSYGDNPQVAAGSTFDLALEFRNTSASFRVENIVMTISTGEGLAISSSSNTMFYDSLAARATQEETLSITALPTAKTGSAEINIGFSYEYVDYQQRNKVSTNQSIAIPIYQPDRFEVELPNLPEYVTAYEEMYISLPYVNKGKSEISNVRAELVSPDGAVSAINGVQNLGNFASGSSGTIDFIFTPQMSGPVDFSFVITYEDPNAEEKTVEFPVSLSVEEPYYPSYDDIGDDPGWDEPVEESAGIPWWVWLIAALVVVALVVLLIAKRKKKKKNQGDLDSFVWNAEPAEEKIGTGGKE